MDIKREKKPFVPLVNIIIQSNLGLPPQKALVFRRLPDPRTSRIAAGSDATAPVVTEDSATTSQVGMNVAPEWDASTDFN